MHIIDSKLHRIFKIVWHNLKFLARRFKTIAKCSLEILMVHYMIGSYINQAGKFSFIKSIVGEFGMCSSLLRMLSL